MHVYSIRFNHSLQDLCSHVALQEEEGDPNSYVDMDLGFRVSIDSGSGVC